MTAFTGPSATVPALDLHDVRHRYGSDVVLDGVDLAVAAGSFAAILGPSGSGKTTLLRVVAGFERAESGTVSVGGRVVDDGRRTVAPERRRIGYVAQDGALFPHLTVAGNIRFGLRRRDRRGTRVSELLDLVGLAHLGGRYPHELSGGQQQRVALARALVVDPELILLDEPFSALDAGLRAGVRAEMAAILRRAGATAVLVTHDQDEALSFADRVAVLRQGRIAGYDTPDGLYRRPADPSLALFLGEANLVPGRLTAGTAQTPLGPLPVGTVDPAVADGDVTVLIRPEQLALGAEPGRGLSGRVVECAYYGHDAMLRVVPTGPDAGPELLVRVAGHEARDPGTAVWIRADGPVRVWPVPADHSAPAVASNGADGEGPGQGMVRSNE